MVKIMSCSVSRVEMWLASGESQFGKLCDSSRKSDACRWITARPRTVTEVVNSIPHSQLGPAHSYTQPWISHILINITDLQDSEWIITGISSRLDSFIKYLQRCLSHARAHNLWVFILAKVCRFKSFEAWRTGSHFQLFRTRETASIHLTRNQIRASKHAIKHHFRSEQAQPHPIRLGVDNCIMVTDADCIVNCRFRSQLWGLLHHSSMTMPCVCFFVSLNLESFRSFAFIFISIHAAKAKVFHSAPVVVSAGPPWSTISQTCLGLPLQDNERVQKCFV